MSVLIKGMEMPKADNWKTIRIYYEGTCAEPNWQGDCKYMQDCEAVPIHPHGRLIDADALKLDLTKFYGVGMILRLIDEQPTIIEAEDKDA